MGADEYRGYLRALYRQQPQAFMTLARDARERDLTLIGPLEWVAVLCDAVVAVAQTRGWEIGGGAREPGTTRVNVSGRYMALPTT